MAKQKVSVTLDVDDLAYARELAGPRGLSSLVAEALGKELERERKRRDALAYFDELDAIDPPTEEEKLDAKRWAEDILASIRR